MVEVPGMPEYGDANVKLFPTSPAPNVFMSSLAEPKVDEE